LLEFDLKKISPELMLAALQECVVSLCGYFGYICDEAIVFSDIARSGIVCLNMR
jgi:hypothetical protein